MSDEIDSTNPNLNPTTTYYDWATPLPPGTSTTNIIGDVTTLVSSINGVSGPAITLNTSLSGLAFSSNPGTSTITLAGTLGPTSGGTGLSTYAQGDILYSSAADTLAKLAKDTNATRYLSNTGASNNPAWAQINLANGVTGILPNANGGMYKINNTATAAPAVTDDSGAGYSVGSLWIDVTNDDAYIAVNVSVGAAVWKLIT